MNSQKSFKIKLSLIAALALAFLIAVGAFLGVTLARADEARKVTLSGSSIFVTSNAEIWAHQEGEGEEAKDYTMFVFDNDGDAVNYRKNLAYKWIENVAQQDEPSEEEGAKKPDIKFEAKDGRFNMEFGFDYSDGIEFKQFVISFDSQQYSKTKDGKTTNYLVFVPAENDKLNVHVLHRESVDGNKSDDGSKKDETALKAMLARVGDDNLLGTVDNGRINLNFIDPETYSGSLTVEGGDYLVQISNGENNKLYGKFENVGKTYSKYSSSTSMPVTPLSFKAFFKEEDENEPEATGKAFLTLYSLNNQSFELSGVKESDGHRTGGTINDDTPPVLCLDKDVQFIKYNGEITFNYTVIDVLTSSPSLTTSYYMLTADDADQSKLPVYNEDGGDYKKVTDSDNQYIFPHAKHYKPTAGDYNATVYDDNFEVKAAVKVVLTLTDTTSTGGQTTYVLLDWFINDNYLIQLGKDKELTYIAVATDKQGATFKYTDDAAKTSVPDNQAWGDLVAAYQQKVTEAAKDLKAGSKNYFYLPSAESLLGDTVTPYADLTFSIYYNNGSQQQSTGKSANDLSINLTKAGKYVFTVYAKDVADNGMYYYKDGEKTDLETGDIWNMYKQDKDGDFAGMKKYLPWFEFTVEESEISIEDPDEQSTAYVDSTFTPDSFEINGVSVKTVYTLYEFQNDVWAKNNGGKAMTYESFAKDVEDLLKTGRQYFTRIRPASELKENTKDYETFNEYAWNGSSLSFTPQKDNAFYVIVCEASSSETAEPVTKCMTIAAAPKVRPLKGEDTWVQDNVTSIILLCIAGACLVGIVLLLVIKPRNKVDVDELIESPKKKIKKK